MQLTSEQIDIINSSGNLKINAVAGSGKTTTIIEYAKSKPSTSKILYIAFNKTVKEEAVRKFIKADLENVSVETAHSLAYRYIVRGSRYNIKKSDFTPMEIASILNIAPHAEKHTEYVLANHVKKYVSLFCNSNVRLVQDVNYLATVTNPKAIQFVSGFLDIITLYTRQLLAKMDKAEIEITHDFYLKKFQLSNIKLPYDFILFDEGQDASNAMLDVFLKQDATKVIVGDTHQQIYSWRYAINSLEQVDFKTLNLSKSFRFKNDIAVLASQVIGLKDIIGKNNVIQLRGVGEFTDKHTKAVIGRTNVGLLKKAIDFVVDNKKAKKIYFEGNFNTYTYADDGASLYDILNLLTNKRHQIRDPFIKSMKNIDELEEYIEKTDDKQLGMMLEIVSEYEESIYDIIKEIKDKHVTNLKKEDAEVIFSTVHRCKGMEYDTVELAADFVSKVMLDKLTDEDLEEPLIVNKWNEEINLLYVAITRAKVELRIPESLLPGYQKQTPSIKVLKDIEGTIMVRTNSEKEDATYKNIVKKGKTVSTTKSSSTSKSKNWDTPKDVSLSHMHQTKSKHKGAYEPWTISLDEELIKLYNKGQTITEIATYFDRTKGAIITRLKKLGVAD